MQQHIDFPIEISVIKFQAGCQMSKITISFSRIWLAVDVWRPKLCEISVQIGPLSHFNDFRVFPRDNIRKPFTLCITMSLNI